MPKPREFRWNPVGQRWESAGRDGLVKAYIDETGLGSDKITIGTLATIEAAKVGSGSQLDFILGFTGSSAAMGVGSQLTSMGTITNATGLAAGDKVFGVPKSTAVSDSDFAVGGFYVPAANTLNVLFTNPNAAVASIAALGWDIIAIRTA